MPATTTKKRSKTKKLEKKSKRYSVYLTPEMELAASYLRNYHSDVYGTSTSAVLKNALLLTYIEEGILDETKKRAATVADDRLQRGEPADNSAEESGTSNQITGV